MGLEAVCFGLTLGALSLEFEPGTNRHLLFGGSLPEQAEKKSNIKPFNPGVPRKWQFSQSAVIYMLRCSIGFYAFTPSIRWVWRHVMSLSCHIFTTLNDVLCADMLFHTVF